ncbi:sensor histidine kinase [Paenibacillus sp. GCM10012307]|uniref:histidine kinase n=1 Tax=Paenibacillus roseus TaxID=2798579 RepID=A0A934MMP5_9BACL|nr:sensor histidine kinase [Paenibacillus roseus]MBJ6360146.1 sensor histidine kinase [Paenibacillus roseus]
MRYLYQKWVYAPFVNLSFRSKMFVVFVLVTIIPMLLFVYFSFDLTKSKLTEQIYINMVTSTAQINKNLENKLDSYDRISAAIYLDNRLSGYLTEDYDDNPSYLEAYGFIGNSIDTIKTAYMDFDEVFIYSDNASLPKDHYYVWPITDADKKSELFRLLNNSHGNLVYLSSPQTKGSPAMFTMARYLNNNRIQYPYGILVFRISESVIYSLMEKEADDKDIFIVNEDGVILSAADKQLLNTSLPKLLNLNQDGLPAGRFDALYKGEKAIAVSNSVKNGWKTVSVFPYERIVQEARSFANLILTISLAFIAIALLLIYITALLFSKRITILIKMVRRVERGDFSPAGHRNLGSDEIGQLHFAFEQMTMRLKNLITEVYQKEISGKEAELELLQAQINPHFLYNTLGSVSSLAMKHNDPRIQSMVINLAKFYRISLNKGKSILTIQEELKLTQSYVAIQMTRFEGQLNITYSVDETILPHSTVKLTLQPFVENSIVHALWDQDNSLNIHIKGVLEGDDIVLSVIDDGVGMSRQTVESLLLERPGRGYGIMNVNRRIKLKFGENYGVKVFSRPGIGTTVQIRLPQKGVIAKSE